MSRTDDGLWELIGITSYGKGCGRLNELGVYTRVSMYRNWIDLTRRNLDDYSRRLVNQPSNVFISSACEYSTDYFIPVSLIFMRINQIWFY